MPKKRAVFVAMVIALASGCGFEKGKEQATVSGSGGGGGGGDGGSGGSGGSGACTEGYVDIEGDGEKRHLAAPCLNSWGAMQGAASASGHIEPGGGAMATPSSLLIQACGDPGEMGFPVFLLNTKLTEPGTTDAGGAYYARTDADTFNTEDTAKISVTQVDEVGGLAKGDFFVTLMGTGVDPSPLTISGVFSVCRVEGPPPKP
jgi:hypothetical protein